MKLRVRVITRRLSKKWLQHRTSRARCARNSARKKPLLHYQRFSPSSIHTKISKQRSKSRKNSSLNVVHSKTRLQRHEHMTKRVKRANRALPQQQTRQQYRPRPRRNAKEARAKSRARLSAKARGRTALQQRLRRA